jgi:hypothetical protein
VNSLIGFSIGHSSLPHISSGKFLRGTDSAQNYHLDDEYLIPSLIGLINPTKLDNNHNVFTFQLSLPIMFKSTHHFTSKQRPVCQIPRDVVLLQMMAGQRNT